MSNQYWEERKESCWTCDYFIQKEEERPEGYCVRRAPIKLDEIRLEYEYYSVPFGTVRDTLYTFCGEYKPSTIPVPKYPEENNDYPGGEPPTGIPPMPEH